MTKIVVHINALQGFLWKDYKITTFCNVVLYFEFSLYVKFILVFCVYCLWFFYVQEVSIMGMGDVPTLGSKVASGIHCVISSGANP